MSATWDIDATWTDGNQTWVATQFVPAGSTDTEIQAEMERLLAAEADECPNDRLVGWKRSDLAVDVVWTNGRLTWLLGHEFPGDTNPDSIVTLLDEIVADADFQCCHLAYRFAGTGAWVCTALAVAP